MIALITGSTGFIGNALLNRLLQDGISVYEWRREGIYIKGKRIYDFCLEAYEETEKLIEIIKPDIVYHCAGAASVFYSVEHPYTDMIDNYLTTHNLLFAIQKKSISTRFILFSSAAVYGNPLTLPINENESKSPMSPYALHKLAAEELCIYMNKNYHIDIKILRIFSVYGPGLKKQFFWDMFKKVSNYNRLELIGNGEESRDYIYITDLIDAALLVANSKSSEIVFNIANGEEVRIKEAAELFVRVISFENNDIIFDGVRREGDPVCWCADISRLKQLGYRRKMSFEDGIREYINWARKI